MTGTENKVLAVILTLLIILFCSCSLESSKLIDSFMLHIPMFGLYCEENNVIQSGTVEFDLTDNELLSSGKGIQKSNYKVSATNCEVEFLIPFISTARNVSSVEIKSYEQAVNGSVWYGDKVLMSDEQYNTNNTYSPILDENVQGTLYSIIPNSDTINVELQLSENKPFIYDTINNTSSTYSIDGHYSWTYTNALSNAQYHFFIIGEPTEYFFTSNCEYTTETKTCIEFINHYYVEYEEFYQDCGGVSKEFFYSMINGILQRKSPIGFEELFFSSVDEIRLNAYKFYLLLDTEAEISYEMPINISQSFASNSHIFLLEQKQVQYLTTYFIELNKDIPYIIVETNVPVEKNEKNSIVKTKDDFYLIFSAEKTGYSLKI